MSEINLKDIESFFNFLNMKYVFFQVFEPRINGKIKEKKKGESKDIHHQWASKEEVLNLAKKYNGQGLIAIGINQGSGTRFLKENIQRIKTFVLDFDVPKHLKEGFVSINEHHQEAIDVAYKAKEYLEKKGYVTGLIVDSGNGAQVYIKIDLENTTENVSKLSALAEEFKQFETENIKVDCVSSDVSRRMKSPGTINKKDIHQKEDRIAKIIYDSKEYSEKANTDLMNRIYISENINVKSEIKTAQTSTSVNEILKKVYADPKAKELYEGDISDYNNDRSSAEFSLAMRLIHKGCSDKNIFYEVMDNCKIGKWQEKDDSYKELTFNKALNAVEESKKEDIKETQSVVQEENIPEDIEIKIEDLTEDSKPDEVYEILILIAKLNDVLWEDEFIKNIKEKTNKNLGALKKGLKKARKENPVDEEDTQFYIDFSLFGIFFCLDKFGADGKETVEFAQFKILEKQEVKDVDVFTQKEKVFERFASQSLHQEDSKIIYTQKENGFCAMLNDAKRSQRMGFTKKIIEIFASLLEDFEAVQKYAVNAYGFLNGTNYAPPEYGLYTIRNIQSSSGRKNIRLEGNISPTFVEFVNLQYEEEIVKKCISYLHEICRDEKEFETYAITLSWSVAAFLKLELKRLGATVFPQYIVVGEPSTGKTQMNIICNQNIWNSEFRQNTDFQGVAGARMLNFPGDVRPASYQEVESIPERMIPIFNEGATRSYLTFTRGNKDQGVIKHTLPQSFSIDANDFVMENPAFVTRNIFLSKNKPLNENINNANKVQYLIENVKHLGKFIFDNLSKFDFENIWDTSKQYVTEQWRKDRKKS